MNAAPFESWPEHIKLFVKLRDGGGPDQVAHSVAELHGISVDELKAQCRRAAEEIRQQNGKLEPYEQTVADWARV